MIARYTVRRPISSYRYFDNHGIVLSRHRTIEGAEKALNRQRSGAQDQGGYSQDYIWDEQDGRRLHEADLAARK